MKKNNGFTLVELLTVIALVGIFVLITIPAVDNLLDKQREKLYEINKETVKDALKNWGNMNVESLPDDNAEVSVTLRQLKKSGLIEDNFKNPKNDKCYSNYNSFKISNVDGMYIYIVNDLIDGNDTDCALDYKPVLTKDSDVNGSISQGDKICVSNECFYVINNDGNNVTMLSEWNLKVGRIYTSSSEYTEISSSEEGYGIQDSEMKGWRGSFPYNGGVGYSNNVYWDNGGLKSQYGTSYPAYVYDDNSNLYQYVYNYKNYLIDLGINVKEARLIKYEELKNLGCSDSSWNCNSAPSWVHSTSYWAGSASNNYYVWRVDSSNAFGRNDYNNLSFFGVRPVIKISLSDIVSGD